MLDPVDGQPKVKVRDQIRELIRPSQPELPLEGLPSMRRIQLQRQLKTFALGFAPRVGSRLLLRVGVPVVGATTPTIVGLFAPDKRDDLWLNLAVGSGLGGVWGAGVGAMLPFTGSGNRVSRMRAAGIGAGRGVLLAPAVVAATSFVTNRLTERWGDGDQAAKSNGS